MDLLFMNQIRVVLDNRAAVHFHMSLGVTLVLSLVRVVRVNDRPVVALFDFVPDTSLSPGARDQCKKQ
jgi:hypothetical protein